MKNLKVEIITALLVYFPLLTIIFMNLFFSSYIFEESVFYREMFIGFIIFSAIYSLFLLILRTLHEKLHSYFIAGFIFLFLVSLEAFIYISGYQAPDFKGLILNFYAIQLSSFLKALLGASAFTVILMFFMGIKRKFIAQNLIGLMLISFALPLSLEFLHRYQIDDFFCSYKEGRIVFDLNDSCFDNNKNLIAFNLSDRTFKEYRLGNVKLSHYSEKKLLPNSKFVVYDYSYDRDDLSKIFVTNTETGKTLLLAGGASPLWVK